MLRCTLHVCGSRRSSDGDVQPSQLDPSRKRRHHINPRHIVIGVSWTVFPLQKSRICRTLSCILGLHELLLARKGVVLAHVIHQCHVRMICFLRHGVAVLVRQPFAIRRRAPFLQGMFLSTSREPPAQCVPRMQLSRSCSVPSGVCVP